MESRGLNKQNNKNKNETTRINIVVKLTKHTCNEREKLRGRNRIIAKRDQLCSRHKRKKNTSKRRNLTDTICLMFCLCKQLFLNRLGVK